VKSLEQRNIEAVYEHMRQHITIMDDYSSIHFSDSTSSYDSRHSDESESASKSGDEKL